MRGNNTQRFERLRAAADAACQKLKNEAYINKALSDLAGGPAAASLTHRQRGMSALQENWLRRALAWLFIACCDRLPSKQ